LFTPITTDQLILGEYKLEKKILTQHMNKEDHLVKLKIPDRTRGNTAEDCITGSCMELGLLTEEADGICSTTSLWQYGHTGTSLGHPKYKKHVTL